MRIKEIKHSIDNKKIKKNIKMALITDVHFTDRFNINTLDTIYKKLKDIQPNYICIVGDLVDSFKEYNKLSIYKLKKWIEDLSLIGKVLISLGNHDVTSNGKCFYNKIWFNNLISIKDVYLLDNTNQIIDNINFIGYTVPFEFYKSGEKEFKSLESVSKLLKLVKHNKFNILLCHTPIGILNTEIFNKYIIKSGIDLILCGHTHGGMLPRFMRTNHGLVAPNKSLFPKNVRGYIKKEVPIIISYGVTKLSRSTSFLYLFNWIYEKNIDIIGLNTQN